MDAHYVVIGTDGRQYGPLSQADIRTWLLDGRVSRYSRACREGETQWLALRDMAEFEDETRPPYLGGGHPEHGDATPPPPLPEQEPRATDFEAVDPTGCFRRGFALVASDFWVLGLAAVATILFLAGLTQIRALALPVGVLLNDLLLGGLFVLYLGAIRGRRPSFDDILARVMKHAVRLILAGLVQSLVTAPLFLVTMLAVTTRSTAAVAGAAVLAIPTLYLAVAYVFLLPLIVDRELSIRAALEASRKAVHPAWMRVFGLMMAMLLLGILSVLMAGIPLLITIPVSVAAFCYAYMDLFGEE